MATAQNAPLGAVAIVSTTPVLRLVAVGEPVVQPLAVRWWGLVPWIDTHSGWPLWWPADEKPANAKDFVQNPAVTQQAPGRLRVDVSLAPGATLDAQPRTGWDVPVKVVASEVKTLTEVLRITGQVATTAHVPHTAPRVVEHDVLDAERGTRLVPSVSSSGVLWVARPAVGYVVVEYEARLLTLEAEFGMTTAPWSPEARQRVLSELVFAGQVQEPPALLLRLDVRDPVTRKTRSEMVQAAMALVGVQNNFGSVVGNQRDPVSGDSTEPDELVYAEIGRTVQAVRVESQQTPGVWVDVDVASRVVMQREGSSQLLVLNFEVPT
ncbi:MAG: hypothetical protein U1E02_45065 [Hydrogenophaga sp.]|nr:hypothetical protein [Hydrogenophaga sp.]MDZ4131298.1 hypothetical protein [Hydrogenophaga sp.]